MGYDVHITRAHSWLDSSDHPISLTEWLAYLRTDPEMRVDEVAIGTVKGKPAVAYANAGLAVWTAWSAHNEKGNRAWFDHYRDRIVVKNPDDAMLHKMKQIASAFNAHVVGDDGEIY